MATLESPKRIRTEDFEADYQELVGKLGFSINDFLQQVYNAFNGNIDFSNINQQVTDVSVRINGSGGLEVSPQIKAELKSKVQGITVIRAVNMDNPDIYPTSCPFLSWTLNGDIVTVKGVSGLQNNSFYKLTCILIGR